MDTCQTLAASYQSDPAYQAILVKHGTSCEVGGVTLDHQDMLAKAVKAGAVSYMQSGSTPATRRQRRADRKAAKVAYAAQASNEFGISIPPKWIAIGVIGAAILVFFGAPALLLAILSYWFEKQLDHMDNDPQAFDELACSIAGAA